MTVNFGQLIEYNTRNIFYEKSYTKCGGETSPRRFSKKSKLILSQDQQFKVLYSLFLFYVKVESCGIYIETKVQRPLGFIYLI